MQITDCIQLLILSALWGGSFLFLRMAAPVLGPVWLIEFRVLLAGLALLPLLIRQNHWGEVRRRWLPLVIVGWINSALPFLFLAFASLSLPAGFTSILNATSPLFGTIVAAVWLKIKPSINQLIGFVLGFVGVFVLTGWKAIVPSASFGLAVTAGLAAALLYGIGANYTKRQLVGTPPLVLATISQLSAALLLVPALPFTVPKSVPSPTIIGAVLTLALLCTAVAYILYFRLIQNVGSAQALTVTYLVPLFAMIWGFIVLGEPITLPMVLGCSLILLGTGVANDLIGKFPKRN